MSLLDSLLKTDIVKFEQPEEATFYSKRLAKAIGSKKPVEVRVRELRSKRIQELVQMQFDKKGRSDMVRAQRANAILATEAVIEPDLRDERLLEHFGCATPADLAVKLFEGELSRISDLVLEISGFVADEDEAETELEEIKNSSEKTPREA
ncbi:MAG: hypothetical protein ACI4RU_07285 [Acutalibacteraceae bacterium]